MRLIMGDTDNTASLTFINFFRKRSDYLLTKLQKTIQEQRPKTESKLLEIVANLTKEYELRKLQGLTD